MYRLRPVPRRYLKDYISLYQFARYKSFFHTIDPSEFKAQQAEKMLSAMEHWITQINDFAGESDPRCLPLHVFHARRSCYDLDAADGRKQFNKDHPPQGSRTDKNGIDWKRAHDMHGREVLQIAGRCLIKGFHWDAMPGSRTSGSKTVSNTVAIWKVSADGHVNIYPDAKNPQRKKIAPRSTVTKKKPALKRAFLFDTFELFRPSTAQYGDASDRTQTFYFVDVWARKECVL